MANVKISQLPEFTGNTSGSWLVMNDSGQTTTYKVKRENMIPVGGGLFSQTGSFWNTTNNIGITGSFFVNNTTGSLRLRNSGYGTNFHLGFPKSDMLTLSDNSYSTSSGSAVGTSGSYSTIIGANAGPSTLNGSKITAIGYNILTSATRAESQLAIGVENMSFYNSTEFDNTSIGAFRTLRNLRQGGSNVAVGSYTLDEVVSGSFNVAIGAAVLQNVSGTIESSRNVAIGSLAGDGITGSLSDTLIIDTRNRGNNTETKALIYGKFNDNETSQSLRLNAAVTIPNNVTISGSLNATGSVYIRSGSAFPNATGSALVAWNSSTGQLTNTTYSSVLPALMAVGAFYSTGSYITTANQSGSFIFDTSLNVNSVQLINSGSKITVDRSGTYNIQFSTQISQGSGAGNIAIWLKKDGTNVADTATYVTVASNHKDVLALNLWDTTTSGSYYELAYQSDSNNTTFETVAATGNIPRSPSIILTVNQVR